MKTGVIVIDKPGGLTSFDVVARVRRTLGERRVGHTGTLDPIATGVLPVCVGEATKLVPFLTGDDKEYVAEAILGVTTDSYDASGRVLSETSASHVSRADVEAALQCFRGAIDQTPPMHSAVRVNGQRLYELAHRGEEIERAARKVTVHAFSLTAFAAPRMTLAIACSKGTYVRSLVADLGAALGVGAHMTALRRTRAGAFSLAHAIALDALGPDTPLLGLADALADRAAVRLDAAAVSAVRQGKVRAVEALAVPPDAVGPVRLLAPDGALVAVAEPRGGHLQLCRVFC